MYIAGRVQKRYPELQTSPLRGGGACIDLCYNYVHTFVCSVSG